MSSIRRLLQDPDCIYADRLDNLQFLRNRHTPVNKPTMENCGKGKALVLDGVNQYLTFGGDYFSDQLTNSPGTVLAWCRLGSAPGGDFLFDFGGYARIDFASDTSIRYDVQGNGAVAKTVSSLGTIWHHYALVWDGSNAQLYLDSSGQGATSDGNPSFASGGRNHNLGCSWAVTDILNAAFRDFIVYKRALTSGEISNVRKGVIF